MSYENDLMIQYNMPPKDEVAKFLLIILFKNNGSVKEFDSNQEIVNNLSNHFNLNEEQLSAYLETIYKKENRVKRSSLWHRLLFRAADMLANKKLISRPSETVIVTGINEWMLTEKGYEYALKLLDIPNESKQYLEIKSYEVQKEIKTILKSVRPENYSPFENQKEIKVELKKSTVRNRAFRSAVIQSYDHKCSVCGLKLPSPDLKIWEVEAAHIVPHSKNGRDDIWNGIAFCRLHHWAFDVGWFTILPNYQLKISQKIAHLSKEWGNFGDFNFFNDITLRSNAISLPNDESAYPDVSALNWHSINIFSE